MDVLLHRLGDRADRGQARQRPRLIQTARRT
jgi:hypothetical protein